MADRGNDDAKLEFGSQTSNHLTRSSRSLAKSQTLATSMASMLDLAVINNYDSVEPPKKTLFNQKDKGWAWMVVFACFLLRVLVYGVMSTVGMLNIVFLEVFKAGKGETAIVSSLIIATGQFTGAIAAVLMNKLGGRFVVILSGLLAGIGLTTSTFAESIPVLIVAYGVITGLGFGLCQVPASVVIAQYFDKKRNLALGLASSGGGFGSLIFPFVIKFLLDTYAWRGTLLLCGGIILHMCICGIIMRPFEEPPKEGGDGENTKNTFFHFSILKDPRFLLLCLNNLMYTFGASVIFVHFVSFAKDTIDGDQSMSAVLLTCFGGATLISKILLGLIANHPKVEEQLLFMITTGIGGIGTIFMAMYPSYVMFVAYALIFGISFAALGGAIIPAILANYLGVDSMASSYGFLMIFQGLGHFSGAPVAGWVYDVTKNFAASLYLGGIVIILSSMLVIVPWKVVPKCCKDKDTDDGAPPERSNLMLESRSEANNCDINSQNGVKKN